MKASIIIPAYNEEKDIGECLESLKRQSYKNMEIIVVDDGSTDRTKEIVKSFNKVRLIKGEHKGAGFSRNLGAKECKGKILVFVDADMTFGGDYVEKLIKPMLEGKSIGTEERFQKASNLDNVWSMCWGSYTKGYPDKEKTGNIFRAILKDKFLELGGFDSEYGYADDLTFFYKYGIRSNLVEAECYHKNSETLGEVYKQSRWIGASKSNSKALALIILLLEPLIVVLLFPYSIWKVIQRKHYKYLLHYYIFYIFRFIGLSDGIWMSSFQGVNIR